MRASHGITHRGLSRYASITPLIMTETAECVCVRCVARRGVHVPERHHLMRVRAHGRAKRAAEAEICQLERPAVVTAAVDQQVLRLEVAVHHPPRVAEGHAG